MLSILSLLLVVTFSILLTRIATVALSLTGLSREAARFQARSALSGTGFTTSEAENVVGHPVRRRIILLLMLLGNAGIITAVSTLILGFVKQEQDVPLWLKVGILLTGVTVLWTLAQSRWLDERLSRLIEKTLRRYSNLEVRDYSSLLHLGRDYRIAEMKVEDEDWLNGKTLAKSQLREEGIVVLGIESSEGQYLGAPKPDRRIESGDTLLVYGRASALARLDERQRGEPGRADHRKAVREQKGVAQQEEQEQEAREEEVSASTKKKKKTS